MRIGGVQNIHKLYAAQMQQPVQIKKESKKDEVSLSAKAMDFQHAYKLAKDLPDTRADKVKDLKERIASGNYNLDAKEISEKLVSQIDMRG